MSNTATVLLICGLPASGKSSFAQRLKETPSIYDRIIHIEYDSVAQEIHAHQPHCFNEESLEAWRSSRKVALERLNQELDFNRKNLLIIMDDNFHLKSMRKNIYRTCQTHITTHCSLYFCMAWIDTPLFECLKRNRQRSTGRLPDSVLETMQTTFEPPAQTVVWEQGCIHITDSTCMDPTLFLQRLQKEAVLVSPPPPVVDPEVLEAERRKTRESLLHQYDKLMRGWVGTVARIRQGDVKRANQARKGILQRLKQEELSMDDIRQDFCNHVVTPDWTKDEISKLKCSIQVE